MSVFFDVEKAVADFRENMRRVDPEVAAEPSMAVQLRSMDVQAEFIRWSLTEVNLDTDQDDLVHATAALVVNILVNTITNTDEKHGATLLPRIFDMLERDDSITASEVHVANQIGGRA